jgi:hypothetical protein
MLRTVLGFVATLSVCAALLAADKDTGKDKDKDKGAKDANKAKATIKNVDAKKGTVTVKMKDKDGKDAERTFRLTEDARYFDSTGKAVAVDVFRSGNYVLIVEREGQLKEMHQDKDRAAGDKKTGDKEPASKKPEKKDDKK